ncbi:MAG: hypothetical protein AB7T49_08980 [Oligoflexales bacterium]
MNFAVPKVRASLMTVIGLLMSVSAMAVDNDDPTLFIDANYGFATYKSKLVESNDLGSELRYGIGGNAGEDHQFGFRVVSQTDTTSFALNESKIATTWEDSEFRYQWGYVSLGLLISRIGLQASREGTEVIDVSGSGYGGSLGLTAPIGRSGTYYLDVQSATASAFHNTLDEEVTSATRMDIDTGARFRLTKNLMSLIVGYKQRTASYKTDASYAEAVYTTYLGLRFAFFF